MNIFNIWSQTHDSSSTPNRVRAQGQHSLGRTFSILPSFIDECKQFHSPVCFFNHIIVIWVTGTICVNNFSLWMNCINALMTKHYLSLWHEAKLNSRLNPLGNYGFIKGIGVLQRACSLYTSQLFLLDYINWHTHTRTKCMLIIGNSITMTILNRTWWRLFLKEQAWRSFKAKQTNTNKCSVGCLSDYGEPKTM